MFLDWFAFLESYQHLRPIFTFNCFSLEEGSCGIKTEKSAKGGGLDGRSSQTSTRLFLLRQLNVSGVKSDVNFGFLNTGFLDTFVLEEHSYFLVVLGAVMCRLGIG